MNYAWQTSKLRIVREPEPADEMQVAFFPVGPITMIRVLVSGPLTESGVRVLIQHLLLGLDRKVYPADEQKGAYAEVY